MHSKAAVAMCSCCVLSNGIKVSHTPASLAISRSIFNMVLALLSPSEVLGHAAFMAAEHSATRVAKACDRTSVDTDDNNATIVNTPPLLTMALVAPSGSPISTGAIAAAAHCCKPSSGDVNRGRSNFSAELAKRIRAACSSARAAKYVHRAADSWPGAFWRHSATNARTPDEDNDLTRVSHGIGEFLSARTLERAFKACALSGDGGCESSGLKALETNSADGGTIAPATMHLLGHLRRCELLRHCTRQPSHAARSISSAAANSISPLPVLPEQPGDKYHRARACLHQLLSLRQRSTNRRL
mmetsp:Transcript_8249/g.25806  ORF Transcript_8249/g.25806 Transcript_8249/m.25806 type:complete len:300 (-) Transcript_8249:657-1556(-)